MWFPDWPLRRPDAPPDRPCLVATEDGIVTAVGDGAAAAGVHPGMRRREAEALCPSAVTLLADPGAETAAFEPVVRAVEDLVPRVEVAAPGLLFVPVAGAVRYYGGEQALATAVLDGATSAAGDGARVAVADGPFAARMAATAAEASPLVVTDTSAFLADLDVAVLGAGDLVDTFRWLGITTLGELGALPRAAIASRFGTPGLEAHRVAQGEDRSVSPRPIPEDVQAEERFDPPLADLERAAFAARSLSHELLDALVPRGGTPHRVVVEAEAADGTVRTRTWRSADPFNEIELAERVRWQLRAWVESGGVPGGIRRLRLVPDDLSDTGRQLHLGEAAVTAVETRRALSRAQGLVGPDAVLQARRQGGREPAEQVQWHRWGEDPVSPARDPAALWPGSTPGPAPVLVDPEPRALEVEWEGGFPTRVRLGSRWEPVLTWAGPWRRTGRWWEGSGPADRYQIVTSAGALLCEVRQGATVLVGVYD